MKKTSVSNIRLLEVIDELSSKVYVGGWQEWYGAWHKRMAGCGPTTVSTIMSYITRRQACGEEEACTPLPKKAFQTLMEAVWNDVTPGARGIPTTAALMKGACAYIARKNLNIRLEKLDIPKDKHERPGLEAVADFLEKALEGDAPVAFLSLDKGKEPLLDSWHWVTLPAVYRGEGDGTLEADITDEGRLQHVDLRNWYETTSLGGGFVRFMVE